MKVRKLISLTSFEILGSVLSLVGSNHPATSPNPVLKADGGTSKVQLATVFAIYPELIEIRKLFLDIQPLSVLKAT